MAEGVRPLDWQRALRRHPVPTDRSAARAAADALCEYAPGRPKSGTGWTFFASVPKLATLAGVSERTIERGAQALRSAGFLELVKRGGGRGKYANVYRLTVPELPPDLAGDTDDNSRQIWREIGPNSRQNVPELPPNHAETPATSGGPTEEYSTEEYSTENHSSQAGVLGTDRPGASSRDVDHWGDDPADDDLSTPEGIDVGRVQAVAASRGAYWDPRGIGRVADELTARYGTAEAMRRLLSAATDPQANTPRAATWDRHARHGSTDPAQAPRCGHCGQHGRDACEALQAKVSAEYADPHEYAPRTDGPDVDRMAG